MVQALCGFWLVADGPGLGELGGGEVAVGGGGSASIFTGNQVTGPGDLMASYPTSDSTAITDRRTRRTKCPGEVRDGGSYETRMSNIAVWNSVMDEHQYLVSKWNEFLAS